MVFVAWVAFWTPVTFDPRLIGVDWLRLAGDAVLAPGFSDARTAAGERPQGSRVWPARAAQFTMDLGLGGRRRPGRERP